MDATAVISGKGYLNLITISAQLKIVEDNSSLIWFRFVGLVLCLWSSSCIFLISWFLVDTQSH